MFKQRIEQALEEREERGLLRKIHKLERGNLFEFRQTTDSVVNYSSNDYMGLASDKQLTQVWQEGLDRYGNGSGSSPLVTGYNNVHSELEETLCDWLGFERAILFNSGFSANQALLFTLLEKGDLLLQDKLNHASLIEAGMLSPATMKRFKHNDVEHLKRLLTDCALVATEGVFSMDGDLAPLADISHAVDGKGWLAVDDAHGIGVVGREGRGSCDYAGVKPTILIVTFGKAFGLSGAAILCDRYVGEYLTQFARHYIYSTSMPLAQAGTLTEAAKMLRSDEWRREKLSELNHYYDQLFESFDGYIKTHTPIKPMILGDSARAVTVANKLRAEGHWVTAIRPPTVPEGRARLRLTLTVNHTRSHLEQLAQSLQHVLKEVR